jgi:hypothetical protein
MTVATERTAGVSAFSTVALMLAAFTVSVGFGVVLPLRIASDGSDEWCYLPNVDRSARTAQSRLGADDVRCHRLRFETAPA